MVLVVVMLGVVVVVVAVMASLPCILSMSTASDCNGPGGVYFETDGHLSTDRSCR